MSRLNGPYILKYLGLILLSGFYLMAGINHFRDPGFYLPLIPPYFPAPEIINILAGIAEVGLGLGVIFTLSRRLSIILMVIMLVAFVPSHAYMIQLGGCVADGLCVPVWVAWVRLVIIHPLLILWAWSYRNSALELTNFKKLVSA